MNGVKLAVVMIVVLILGEISRWDVLDKLFFVLAGLFVVALVWSRFSLRGLVVTRQTRADRAQVGQTLSERIRVQNLSRPGKLWVEILDHSDIPGHRMSRVINLGGQDARSWKVETWCSRRGRFRIGPITLRSGDPFGLFPTNRVVPQVQELLVYPATVELSSFRLPVGDLPGGNSIQRRTPFVTPNASGVRQYLPGDSFNRIAWRATARTGALMVKEFELDPTADIWLVLDLDAEQHAAATRPAIELSRHHDGAIPLAYWLDSTEEYVVTVAASLARHFLDQNRNVGLITNNSQPTVLPTDRGGRQMVKILEFLAVVHADGTQPLAETLLAEGGNFSRNSTVIVITSSTSERWAQAVMNLIARNIGIVTILVERSTFDGGEGSLLVISDLAAIGVPTYLIKHGDDIGRSLATQSATLMSRRSA
ncbi:MAG TPA: DUF58 domain-containing protein [Thermomicrobiaceae bacterium]|nr:DUF58 domain-containing protein [Thermomicrobiaceae bacterium]